MGEPPGSTRPAAPAGVPSWPVDGLTTAEVAVRTAEGRANVVSGPEGRTLRQIVRANVLTRFNAILGALFAVVLVVGPIQDALFGIVLAVNTAIGLFEEVRAKRLLDRLAVLTAPAAHARRDGFVRDVAVDAVVADDVLEICAGDQVVADGVLVEAAGLELVNPTPTVDDRGKRVFVHPRSSHGVLIGLVELHRSEATESAADGDARRVFGRDQPGFAEKTFVPAVSRRGDVLCVSGLNAIGPSGRVEAEDVVGQARCILAKLGEILAEAGATFDNVVKTTDFILSREGYRGVAEVRREFFGSTFPAATGVVVKELLGVGVIIEMDAIAVV